MIHAGTMSSGSGRTCGVDGAYSISSIRRLRKTTLPGVIATLRPGAKFSAPTGDRAPTARSQSSIRFCAPRIRLAPNSARVRSSTSGLVHGAFDGESTSRNCRVANATMLSLRRVTPRTPVIALCHHCWLSRKAW